MIDRLQSLTVEDRPKNRPRVEPIDSESATSVINAIASETARRIITTLHDEPSPPSKVADRVDTSIANVNYHLQNLEEAGLVTDVDTWYSEKGREMKVYAPTTDPLVFSATEARAGDVRSLLQQVGVGVVLLAVASAFVQWLVNDVFVVEQMTTLRKATPAGTVEGMTLTPVPPGLLFFTGGTFVLSIVVFVWYARTRVS